MRFKILEKGNMLLEIIDKFNRIIQPVTPLAYNIQNDPTEFIQQAFVDAFIPLDSQFINSETREIRDDKKDPIAMFGGDIMTTTRRGLCEDGTPCKISKKRRNHLVRIEPKKFGE